MTERTQSGTEDPNKLWAAVTSDVTPLKKPKRLTPSSVAPQDTPPKKTKIKKPKALSPQAPPVPPPHPKGHAGLDKRTDEKLRKGKMAIEATLDLHGLSQIKAYEALKTFIIRMYQAEKRCVLVITGKGREDPLCAGKGVLKQKLPEWLGEEGLRGYVLQTHPARPAHGGSGALYVLLRRNRAKDQEKSDNGF